jgi:O-methyltransferase
MMWQQTRKQLLSWLGGVPKEQILIMQDDINTDKSFNEIASLIQTYTITSIERQYSLFKVIDYIVNNEIKGAIVECGVWRGGSSMLAALRLVQLNEINRDLYLYDTFSGMSKPSNADISTTGVLASEKWSQQQREEYNDWCYAPLDEVKRAMEKTKYPSDKLQFIVGKVEDTIPNQMPQNIAVLRLDTDWYESTRHELVHLYPLLSPGGVLILDDYGYWSGSKKAVDEYFASFGKMPLMQRIDNTGRLIIKPLL